MIVPVVAEMYAVCAIRYVSRQMVPVEACDRAEGFVCEEGPATNSVYCIHYYFRLWCVRLGTAVTHVSSLRTLTLRAAKADESARGIRANSAQADLLPILLWRVLQNHCRRSCDAYITMNGINVKLCYSSIYHIFIRQLFKI